MEIIELQTELAKVDPRYVDWLRLEKKDGIIKGYPTRKLSIEANTAISKFFKGLGGKFVANNGERYFELADRPAHTASASLTEAYLRIRETGIYKEVSA